MNRSHHHRHSHRVPPLLACLGILLLANTASAADMPQLAVVGLHQAELDAADQERAARDLVAAIDEIGTIDGLLPGEVVATITGREEVILSDGLLGPGRRFLADGRNLYNQAQPEDAIPALQQAIESLSLGQAAANNTKDLWEAWIYLATSLQALERLDEADAAFRAAVALNPGRTPSAAIFPPPVVEAYAAAKEALAPHAVTLQVDVAGDAAIYVDGERVGSGTVTLTGVYPGEHHVLARGNGVQAYQKVTIPLGTAPAGSDAPTGSDAPIGSDAPTEAEGPEAEAPAEPVEGEPAEEAPAEPAGPAVVEVRLELTSPSLGSPAESSALRGRQTAALYRALGEHAQGVELILLAGTADNLLHLQLYSPSTDAFSKPMGIPFSGDADDEAVKTVPLLLNLLDEDGTLPAANTSPLTVPLDLGTNSELAGLLTQPREPVAIGSLGGQPATTKKGGSKVLPLVLGAVGIAAIGSGTYVGVRTVTAPKEPVHNGTIVVGPF